MNDRELPSPTMPGPDGYLLAAAAMLLVAPAALVSWVVGAWARPRCARWVLPAVTVVFVAVMVGVRGWVVEVYGDLGRGWLAVPQGAGLRPSWALLGAAVAMFGRSLVLTAPVGIPVGLAAAHLTPNRAVPTPPPATVVRRLERTNVQRSAYLARVLASDPAGDLAGSWYDGKHLVLPDRESRLSRLAVGRPHAGKSVYILREVYLAGRLARRATVADCKGEPGFVGDVVAAYREGWSDGGHAGEPSVHCWPTEPLNAWTGGPVAVANRLLACWTFDLAAQWYREVCALALRLALAAPGPPVTCSADLVTRTRPGVLAQLWDSYDAEQDLVRALEAKDKLADVSIRISNLMASLGRTLDGTRPLGTADVTVLSLPTMAMETDAAAILRVALADLAHHVAVRKPPGTRELIVVDEFSAVPGGRDHAIHLVERGRSAGVAVLLAVQSDRGLGDDADADRIIGAVGTVVLFATAEPERLVRLAGTRRQVETTSYSYGNDMVERYTTSKIWVDQVDPNVVRALQPGQAYLMSGGRAQLCQVIRPPETTPTGLTEPCAPAPARAVISRELPTPVQPRQPPSPTGGLRPEVDGPGRSSVRRDRPPPVGGETAPPDDRDNQQEEP